MPEIPQSVYDKIIEPGAATVVDTNTPPATNDTPEAPIQSRVQPPEQRRSDIMPDPPPTQDTPPVVVTPPPPAASAPTFDETKFFEEKSGGKFKSWDDINAELTKPPQVIKETEPVQWANDTSKQIAELLNKGEYDKVLPFIQKHAFAKQLPSLDADALILAHIREEYPSLSEAQARREMERRYGIDETRFSSADLEIEKTMLNDKKARDADKARQYFTTTTEAIQLPVAEAPKPAVLDDKAKTALAFGATFGDDKVSNFGYEFAPQDSPIKVSGKISLPTDEIKTLSEQIGSDPISFITGLMAKRWYKGNEPDPEAIARDVFYLNNPQYGANKIAEQTANQTWRLKIQKDNHPAGDVSGVQAADVIGDGQENVWDKFFRIPAAKNGQPV